MSRIQLFSDIHTEFIQGKHEQPIDIYKQLVQSNVDLLVIAGDLGAPLDEFKRWKEQAYIDALTFFCNNYPHVLLIPGNHDFYHGSFDRFRRFASRLLLSNLTIQTSQFGLEEYKLNEDTMIYASTLWFKNRPSNSQCFGVMNDSRYIEDSLNQIHAVAKKQVEDLKKKVGPNDVVITHHAPTSSILSRYEPGYAAQQFYYNEDAEKVIKNNKPKVWCFGHTHISEDKIIGETRLISNPMGYYGHNNSSEAGFFEFQNINFKPDLVIEV